MTIKHTEKLSIKEATKKFGTKNNYVSISQTGTDPQESLQGGHVVSWIDSFTIYYSSRSDEREALKVYFGTPVKYRDEGLNQFRKCYFNSIDETDSDLIEINIHIK